MGRNSRTQQQPQQQSFPQMFGGYGPGFGYPGGFMAPTPMQQQMPQQQMPQQPPAQAVAAPHPAGPPDGGSSDESESEARAKRDLLATKLSSSFKNWGGEDRPISRPIKNKLLELTLTADKLDIDVNLVAQQSNVNLDKVHDDHMTA